MGVLGSLAGSWRCCRDGHINHPILSPDRCILDGHRRCRVCSASSGGPAVRPVSYAALRNTNLREEADLSPQDRFDPVGGTSPEELEVVENGSTEKELDVDEGASKQNYHLDEDSGYMELGADEGADWSPQDEFDLFGGISPEEFAIDQLKKDIGIEGPSSGGGIPKNDLNPESTMSMQNFDLINPLPRIVHVNQVNLPTVVKEILHRRFDAITQFLHDASITFVLRLVSTCAKNFDYWKQYWEPSLASGKIRIRWTCQCGKMLWDDFEELRPGAADSLRIDLDSYKRASVTVSKPHSLISQAAGSNTPQIPPPVHTTASILGSASRASIRHTSALISSTYSEHNSGTSQASTAGATLSAASPDENFLLLCSSKPNDTLRLSQLYVGNINDDVGLFRRLKEVYTEKRGTLTRLFSLRKLKSINFRKFERHPRERVVILSCPNITEILPRRTNPRACHRQHEPPRCNTAYDIEPMPPDLAPYVGRNGLEHLLKHPHEAADQGNNLPIQNVWLKRFPKKKTKLKSCPIHQYGLGWGIEFEEGWDRVRVMAVAVVWITAAISFLICWWKVYGDLQGAAGMGSLLLGSPALLFTAYTVSCY